MSDRSPLDSAPRRAAGGTGSTSSTPERPVGICVSGGGLRAASFGLGALQALDERRGLLTGEGHADFLTAVSGGSYVAGAFALAAKPRYPGEPDAELGPPADAVPPFRRGSPEELWIRRNCRYLLDVPGGVLSTLWLATIRLANVLLFVFLLLFVIGRPAGWAYGAVYPEFAENLGCRRSPSCHHVDLKVTGTVPTVALLVIAAGVVLALLGPVRRWSPRCRSLLEKSSARILIVGVVALLLVVVLPAILAAMENTRRATAIRGTWLAGFVATDARSASTAAVGLVVSLLVAVSGLRAARVADLDGANVLRRLAIRAWPAVAGLLASLAGPVLGLAVLLRIVLGGAVKHLDGRTQHTWDLVWWLAAVVLVALAVWQADIVAWSLHSTYKRRLFRCFGVRRTSRAGIPAATARNYNYPFPLSETYPFVRAADARAVPGAVREPGARFPALIVCAALNVSDRGETPAGSKVLPWIFSAEHIGVPQQPVDEWSFDTRMLEDAFGQLDWYESGPPRAGSWLRRLVLTARGRPFLSLDNRKRISLPAAMAIAGAAFSPSMGRLTRAPVRFLMALFNLRLGVWLPNPRNQWVRQQLRQEHAELRMWSRPWYLFFEMFGRNKLDKRFVYVSDGGHYENLGLVELVRRRCTTIWCVDSSGDPPGTASTLAQAMSLARAEHNVEIELDLDRFALTDQSTPAARRQRAVHACGVVHYPASDDAPAVDGTITVVKLGLTGSEPSDLLDYQRRHPTFPYDSTANQLYNAERFDAYHALGYMTTVRALEHQ